MKYTYSNVMECSKHAEFPKYIKELAWKLNLKLQMEIEESGLIFKRQVTRFRVDGEKDIVENFVKNLNDAVDDYEEQTQSLITSY